MANLKGFITSLPPHRHRPRLIISRISSLSNWRIFVLVLFSLTIVTLMTFGLQLEKSGFRSSKGLTNDSQEVNSSSSRIILKPMGGIGNQLFRFACSYSLSRDLGVKLILIYPDYLVTQRKTRKFGPKDREYVLDYFNIPHTPETSLPKSMLGQIVSRGQTKRFNERDIWAWNNNSKTNSTKSLLSTRTQYDLFLNGYCESYTLFQNYESEVLDQLQLSTQKIMMTHEVNTLLDLIQGSESVAVHFRLGDFKRSYDFRALPLKYQMNAMTLALKKLRLREINWSGSGGRSIKFFIFSNEIKAVRRDFLKNGVLNKFSAHNASIIFVSNPRLSSIQEFFLMVVCRHFIISNSTFSWWASYLSKYFRTKKNRENELNNDNDTMIIAPKPRQYLAWYKQSRSNRRYIFTDNHLYYPSDWITINPFI